MGNGPQDETPHLYKRVRPLADDQLDRSDVEGPQGLEQTDTNGRGLFRVIRRNGRFGKSESVARDVKQDKKQKTPNKLHVFTSEAVNNKTEWESKVKCG